MGKGGYGNQNAVKLKTPELKAEAYRQYCAHIASGKCKESFYFEHPDLTITFKTLDKYIEEDPIEFPPIQKEVALCKSLSEWEKKGHDMLDGHRDAETALYQLFMRNKFGWDKNNQQVIIQQASATAQTLQQIDGNSKDLVTRNDPYRPKE